MTWSPQLTKLVIRFLFQLFLQWHSTPQPVAPEANEENLHIETEVEVTDKKVHVKGTIDFKNSK